MNQILNKWDKKVICEGEESTKELAEKNKDNLSRADLSRADLSGADLSGANLSGANLSGANFLGVNLSGADLSEIKNLPQQSQSNLHILKWQKSPLIGFKYLNKQTSPYRNFEYKIGRTYFCKDGNADERNLCGKGINLASLEWCLQDTNCDLSRTYGVFQFNPKDIIAIPYNSDGKFRVKKAKYLRNLTTKEIKQAMKLLYQTHNK